MFRGTPGLHGGYSLVPQGHILVEPGHILVEPGVDRKSVV